MEIRQTTLHSIPGIIMAVVAAAADVMDTDKGECSVPRPRCQDSNKSAFE